MTTINGHAKAPRFNLNKPRQVAFDNRPPSAGPELFVLRLKGDEFFTFTIWSEEITGMWTHWGKGKSEPHYVDEDNCPGCNARRPRRWKGFIHAYCFEKKQEVLVELTPSSAKSLLDQLGAKASLRGNRIQVKRTKGANGRLLISVLTACPNPQDLPPAKDPKASILKLWGFDEDEFDKAIDGPEGEEETPDFK